MNSNYPTNSEQDNDWAKNLEGDYVHISKAQSGANGYHCLGCDKEMLAAKGLIKKHYFRHVVKDADNSKKECVNSSREYREKLAYFYFMRVKKINLPAVYKYPPNDVGGLPYLIEEKQTIFAQRVDREVTFFEDENGQIHSGKNTKVDERYLSIRPDAVFYDSNEKPILFVEFIVTHKPDTDKLNKLQRLGINTVQIIVPKLNEFELEKEISKASKIKWTYNENESNTEYIPVFEGNSEGILSIDEEQRKLFEESYFCRAAQVANLIRSIKRCVESQSYKRVEHQFEREISRIEEATKRHRERLDELERKYEEDIFAEFENEAITIEETGRNLREKEKEWSEYYSDVETRFYSKSRKLKQEQAITREQLSSKFGISNTEEGIREEYNNRIKSIRREEEYIAREEGLLLNRERGNRDEEIDYKEQIKRLNSEEQSRAKSKINRISKQIEDIERTMESLSADFARENVKLEGEYLNLEEQLRKGIRSRKTGNRSRIEEFRKSILQFIDGEMPSRIELSDRIKKLSEARRFLYNYEERKRSEERLRIIIECIRKGDYKKWDR